MYAYPGTDSSLRELQHALRSVHAEQPNSELDQNTQHNLDLMTSLYILTHQLPLVLATVKLRSDELMAIRIVRPQGTSTLCTCLVEGLYNADNQQRP
jgi:hypothetical protein